MSKDKKFSKKRIEILLAAEGGLDPETPDYRRGAKLEEFMDFVDEDADQLEDETMMKDEVDEDERRGSDS
jgi:hypothetical protein